MSGALTVFTSTRPAQLGKVFTLQDGQLHKEVAGNMAEGSYEVKTFDSRETLASLLQTIGTNQAISTSLPRTGELTGRVLTEAKAKGANCLARTKKDFPFKAVQGIMTLDYDPPKGQAVLMRDELWAKLLMLCPAIAQAGAVWWSSGSSFIHSPTEQLQGLRGQRLYLLIQDVSDTERAGGVIRDLCWANGLGRVDISASGSLLKRSLWDEAMHQPARLDFIGGAICTPPLHQDRREPVLLGGNGWLDTRTALPDQTEDACSRVERIQQTALEQAQNTSSAVRAKWADARIRIESTRLQKEQKLSEPVAQEQGRRIVEAALAGTLQGSYRIPLPDGRFVTVTEVLDNWQTWDKQKTLDPLEPEHRGGEACGMLFLSGGTPNLYSFAHGGITYRLARQPVRVVYARGRQSICADELALALSAQGDIFYAGGGDIVQALPGRFAMLDKAAIQYQLGHRVQLVGQREGRDVPMNIPAELVTLAMAALGQKPAQTPPLLRSVTSLPYATSDRVLVPGSGYNALTGIFNTMIGAAIELPDVVTREDCLQALKSIWAPWTNYVWSTPADRAGMLSAIFTTVLRPAMAIAPGVFFDAPVQASGKTKAALALGALMTGDYVGVTPFVDSRNQEEEYSKAIISLLRSERRFWLLDNVVGRFESAALAGLITSGRVQGRILGLSKEGDFSGRVMLCATGNNATLGSDLSRRFLCCRIDTGVEKPSEVSHRFEPAQVAKETRMEIAIAVLTILKAYWAGSAIAVQGGSDFHEWSALVREPILWLQQQGLTEAAGLGEVCDPAKALGGADCTVDSAQLGHAQLLAGVKEHWGLNKNFHICDLHKLYVEGEQKSKSSAGMIREALENITGGKPQTPRSLGQVVLHRRDRRVAGMRFVRTGSDRTGVFWQVQV